MSVSIQSSMVELVAEYARVSGKTVKSFKSKAVGLAAIERAAAKKGGGNGEVGNGVDRAPLVVLVPPASEAAPAIIGEGDPPVGPAVMLQRPKRERKRRVPAAAPAAEKPKAVAKKAAKKAAKKPRAKREPRSSAISSPEDRAARVWATEKGAGGMIVKLLKQRKDDEAIVAAVLKQFPDSRAKVGTVQWYKSMGRRAGWKG